MIFHHHQLEKIQKHQRAHIRILHKKTPGKVVKVTSYCMGSLVVRRVNCSVPTSVEVYRGARNDGGFRIANKRDKVWHC